MAGFLDRWHRMQVGEEKVGGVEDDAKALTQVGDRLGRGVVL